MARKPYSLLSPEQKELAKQRVKRWRKKHNLTGDPARDIPKLVKMFGPRSPEEWQAYWDVCSGKFGPETDPKDGG